MSRRDAGDARPDARRPRGSGEPYPLRQPLPRRQKLGGLEVWGRRVHRACKGTSNERRPPPGGRAGGMGASAWCGSRGPLSLATSEAQSQSTSTTARSSQGWRRSPSGTTWDEQKPGTDTQPPGSIRSLPTPAAEFWKAPRIPAPLLGHCPPGAGARPRTASRWRDVKTWLEEQAVARAAALSARRALVNVAECGRPQEPP